MNAGALLTESARSSLISYVRKYWANIWSEDVLCGKLENGRVTSGKTYDFDSVTNRRSIAI
jgi:hypothetical protein